jgi:hypothetical protein
MTSAELRERLIQRYYFNPQEVPISSAVLRIRWSLRVALYLGGQPKITSQLCNRLQQHLQLRAWRVAQLIRSRS